MVGAGRGMSQRIEAAIVIFGAFGYFIFGAIYAVFDGSANPPITEGALEFLLIYEAVVAAVLGAFLLRRGWTARRPRESAAGHGRQCERGDSARLSLVSGRCGGCWDHSFWLDVCLVVCPDRQTLAGDGCSCGNRRHVSFVLFRLRIFPLKGRALRQERLSRSLRERWNST